MSKDTITIFSLLCVLVESFETIAADLRNLRSVPQKKNIHRPKEVNNCFPKTKEFIPGVP